jgi:hypothetical protein
MVLVGGTGRERMTKMTMTTNMAGRKIASQGSLHSLLTHELRKHGKPKLPKPHKPWPSHGLPGKPTHGWPGKPKHGKGEDDDDDDDDDEEGW